jgi:hypothetical protein
MAKQNRKMSPFGTVLNCFKLFLHTLGDILQWSRFFLLIYVSCLLTFLERVEGYHVLTERVPGGT